MAGRTDIFRLTLKSPQIFQRSAECCVKKANGSWIVVYSTASQHTDHSAVQKMEEKYKADIERLQKKMERYRCLIEQNQALFVRISFCILVFNFSFELYSIGSSLKVVIF